MRRTRLATGAIRKQSFVGAPTIASNEGVETQDFNPDPFRHVILGGSNLDNDQSDTLFNRTIQAYWSRYEQTGHKEKRAVVEQCVETMRGNGVVFLRRSRKAFAVIEPQDSGEYSNICCKVTRRLRAEVLRRTAHLTEEEKLTRERVFSDARKAKRNWEKFQENEFNHKRIFASTASSFHSNLFADFTALPEDIQHERAQSTYHEGKEAHGSPWTESLGKAAAWSTPRTLVTEQTRNYVPAHVSPSTDSLEKAAAWSPPRTLATKQTRNNVSAHVSPSPDSLEKPAAWSTPITLAIEPTKNYVVEQLPSQHQPGQCIRQTITPPSTIPVAAKKQRAENLVPSALAYPTSLFSWKATPGQQVNDTVNPLLESLLIGAPDGFRSMKIPVPIYLAADMKFPVYLDELQTEFVEKFRSLHEFTFASNDWDGFSVHYSVKRPKGLCVNGSAKVVNMVVDELENYLQNKTMIHNCEALQNFGAAVDVEVDATQPLGATLGGPEGEVDMLCISSIHAGGELANALGKQYCTSQSPCAILEAIEGIKCQNIELLMALKDAAVGRGQQTVSLQLRVMTKDKSSLLCSAPPKLRPTLRKPKSEANQHGVVGALRAAKRKRASALREDPALGGYWMDGVLIFQTHTSAPSFL